MKIPITDTVVNDNRKVQSIAMFCTSPAKPVRELMVMISKEVPMAFFIGSLANFSSAGIIRNPPPAPIRPISIPTKKS